MATRTYINPQIIKIENSNLYGFRILMIGDDSGVNSKTEYFTSEQDAKDGLLNYISDLINQNPIVEERL